MYVYNAFTCAGTLYKSLLKWLRHVNHAATTSVMFFSFFKIYTCIYEFRQFICLMNVFQTRRRGNNAPSTTDDDLEDNCGESETPSSGGDHRGGTGRDDEDRFLLLCFLITKE